MVLEAGTKLDPYEILSPLGAGGMGEVYLAKDTKLDRDVAIKLLPATVSRDAERVARFQREAKVLASLNHPNIAAIYGFEEADGKNFLVLELVEGETLAQGLARGAMPIEEALDIARQIAEALEAAHEKGIIHRDLKPANVKVSPEGRVKVLDFGLAKALVAETSGTDVANSPTISVEYTRPGVVLGTAAYMSPEQARGRSVDKRTDIWSFGVVLYECLGGVRPFDGETTSDLVARILEREPDWDALPPSTPRRVRSLLRRCLTKDRTKRLRDIGDARIELEELLEHPEADDEWTRDARDRSVARWIWPAVSVLLLVALVVSIARSWNASNPARITAKRTVPVVTTMMQLTDEPGMQYSPSLSPDGRMLLYVARDGMDTDIFLQRVGGENAINLTSDCAADDDDPAFSPDGERIAFRSQREGGGLFIMGATGESPRRVCKDGFDPAWSPDGRSLVFTTEDVEGPYSRATVAQLWILDLQTHQKELLTKGDAVGPVFSPSGVRVAFWTVIAGVRDIFTIATSGGEPRPVTQDIHTDWNPFFSPDGRTLYYISDRSGTPDLWQVPINEKTGEVTGAARPVTAGAGIINQATISADGQKIAFTALIRMGDIQRYAFDAQTEKVLGDAKTVFASTSMLYQFDVTRDGRRMAYRTGAPREDLVVMNVDGTGRRRLMDDVYRDRGPIWNEAGDVLYFYSNRGGHYNAWQIFPDGTGAKPLTHSDGSDVLDVVVSLDGKLVATNATRGMTEVSLLFELDQPLSAISELPTAPKDTLEKFGAMRFSPDNRYLVGTLPSTPPSGNVAVLDLQTMKRTIVRAADGEPLVMPKFSKPNWIDNTHLITWDVKRGTTFAYDVANGTLREIDGLQGPCDIRMIEGGAALITNRTREESNVWLLTLGTIDDTLVDRASNQTP